MQSQSDALVRVNENSYCPDYINRKYEKEHLENFINKNYK